MSRLIDADSLFNWGDKKLKNAVKYGNKGIEQLNWSYSTLMMYEIAYEINDAPTIDAVPVVRCKECKNNPDLKTGTKGMLWCRKWQKEVRKTDFCSYGKRKED